MYVDNINLLSSYFDSSNVRHKAIIHFAIGTQNITLSCTANLHENAPETTVIDELIADAKRQVLRMPEYRSRVQLLKFPANAETLVTATAA